MVTFSNDQPGGAQGLTHTDDATENVTPAAQTPDLFNSGVGILLVVAGGALLVRRRRSLRNSHLDS